MVKKMSLEERIERLEAENERLWAVNEIQNVMSKWIYLANVIHLQPEELDALHAERDDTSISIMGGSMTRGIESIRKLNEDNLKADKTVGPGIMAETALASPVIEVAKDGKTAKGFWVVPGHFTIKDRETGKLRPQWRWEKFATDFIKEDGKWKIWHVNTFAIFYTDYDKSWVETGTRKPEEMMGKPDTPNPFRHNPYNVNTQREFVPAFPKPYETYDGSMDWIDPLKPKE